MTRDHRRDLEAHGGVIVSRYCADCRKEIIIEDEPNEARDWAAHLARHRRQDGRTPQ